MSGWRHAAMPGTRYLLTGKNTGQLGNVFTGSSPWGNLVLNVHLRLLENSQRFWTEVPAAYNFPISYKLQIIELCF